MASPVAMPGQPAPTSPRPVTPPSSRRFPNRWLVVRLPHGTASLRAWVLLANRADHQDLSGFTEPGPLPAGTTTGASGRRVFPRETLTAVCGGDPAWAATYDAVIDRFAFHDPLDDLPQDSLKGLLLSYLVVGWWSDPTLNPLHDCTTVGAYHDRTTWLGWLAPDPSGLQDTATLQTAQQARMSTLKLGSPSVSGTGPVAKGVNGPVNVTLPSKNLLEENASLWVSAGPAVPRQTLLHGSVLGVPPMGGKDMAPPASQIEVAIGPTGYAALSALLSEGSEEDRASSERVLAAFASGLLSTIDNPGGLAAVDEDRHASAFTAVGGGTRSRPNRIAEGDIMAVDRPTAIPENRDQLAGKGGPTEKERRTAQVRLEKKTSRSVEGSAYAKRFPELQQPTKTPRTFRDISVPLPRTFTPTDLAFVLRGVVRSLRHGGDGRFTQSGELACRLTSQVIQGIEGLLMGEDLPAGLLTLGSGAIPPEADLLLRELVLTDPYRWQEQAGFSNPTSPANRAAAEQRLKAEHVLRAQTPQSRGLSPELTDDAADALRRASLVKGTDPSPVAMTRWAQPWIPLWCDWELEVLLDGELDRWTLGPTDFELVPEATAPLTSRTVQGRSLLTSTQARALSAKIRSWLSDEDAREAGGQGQATAGEDAELASAAAAADGLDVLAGTFHGVKETLLGLDPVDAARVLIAADGTPQSKPLAEALPLLLAGGAAQVLRLRVIDAFGRYLDLPDAQLTRADIATALLAPEGAPHLTLPPACNGPPGSISASSTHAPPTALPMSRRVWTSRTPRTR